MSEYHCESQKGGEAAAASEQSLLNAGWNNPSTGQARRSDGSLPAPNALSAADSVDFLNYH